MSKIKIGIIGMGFIGVSHIEAIRRIGFLDLVAVADANPEIAMRKAREYDIPKYYASIDELIADDEIQAVHDCTPNNLHLSVNEKVICAGKHIFSEKPLAMTSAETQRMLDLLKAHPEVVHGVNYNYRMNPLAQDMKNRIASGELGMPRLIHGSYLQDWLLYDTDYNWRIEEAYAGPSRCVADIGTHWMDLAQTITGLKITEVCANVVTALPVRKKPTGQVETFSINVPSEYEERRITTEDYAGALLKFENGASGMFQCSQISAGRKCFLNIEVNGAESSFYWNQEQADHMWIGHRDANNEQVFRNPNLMTPPSKPYTYLAAGHPEGWNDAFRNSIFAYYTFIRDGKRPGVDPCDFATFHDGHDMALLTEAILQSGRERRWIQVRR